MSEFVTYTLKSNPIKVVFIIYCAIFLFISSSSNLKSIEVINYNNPTIGITGIYDSQDYGLVFANSTGIFNIDKSTGNIKSFEFENPLTFFSFQNIFEFKGELYFYHEKSSLFVYRDNNAPIVSTNVVAHYCKDDKIYLIRSQEPRLQVIDNGIPKYYSLNDTEGWHASANYYEHNDEVYGYVRLNWTGNLFVFKMTDSGPEFIIEPNNPSYHELKEYRPHRMRLVNGKPWFNGIYGKCKYVDGDIVPWDEDFSFSDKSMRDFYYENGYLYVLTSKEFIKADLSNKTESIIYDLEDASVRKFSFFRGKNLFYILQDSLIFTYNPQTEEFAEYPLAYDELYSVAIESQDEEVILLRVDRIEWYNDSEPTVFGIRGIHTNQFLSIDYDIYNNRIIALGKRGDDYILQFFDGSNWSFENIPYNPSHSSSSKYNNLKADLYGNVIVAIGSYMGFYNGKNWEQISFIKNPDLPNRKQREFYNVMLRDSAGGVWISAYLEEFSEEANRIVNRMSIHRIYNGYLEVIYDDLPFGKIAFGANGICLRDNTVIIDFEQVMLYRFKNHKMNSLPFSDGSGGPYKNPSRNLSVNFENELILNFTRVNSWDSNHGSFNFPAQISVLEDGVWNHNRYTDIVRNNNLEFYSSLNIFDTYGNNWILTSNNFLRINSEDSFSIFPLQDSHQSFAPNMKSNIQIGNTIWFASPNRGLYQVNLPAPLSVQDNDLISNYIINPVVTGSHLELTEEVRSYSIFSLSGQEVARGSHASLIDVELLSSGIYFIKAETYEETFINKFQIAR